MTANEGRTGRLLHHDVNDILAIEVALVAQELLLSLIVIFGVVLGTPTGNAIRASRGSLPLFPSP